MADSTTTTTTTTAATSTTTTLNTPALYILTTIEITPSAWLIPGITVPASTYTVTPSTTAPSAASAEPTSFTTYTTLPSRTSLATAYTTASAIATIPFASLFPSSDGTPIGNPTWSGSSPFGTVLSQTAHELSQMQKIALGLGVGLGVVLITVSVVLGYWLFLRRRERRLRQHRGSTGPLPITGSPPDMSSPGGADGRVENTIIAPPSPASPTTRMSPTRSGTIPKVPRRSSARGRITRTGTGDSRIEFASPMAASPAGRRTAASETASDHAWGRLRGEESASRLGVMPTKVQDIRGEVW